MWNGKTGQKIKDLVGHKDSVWTVAFSPDGNYLVSGSQETKNNLILWNGKTGQKIKDLVGHKDKVYTVAFSPDSNYLVSGSWGEENNLILWYHLDPATLTLPQAEFLYHVYWAKKHGEKINLSLDYRKILETLDQKIQTWIKAMGILHID